jgi:hypothetical protein
VRVTILLIKMIWKSKLLRLSRKQLK